MSWFFGLILVLMTLYVLFLFALFVPIDAILDWAKRLDKNTSPFDGMP
jgi:hypothetical protein